MLWKNILLLLASIILLWKGADYLVESASRIAEKIGVSELVIGLTIVAFGTSAPELAVSVSAAVKGQTSISLGNIIGSNIFNLGFILGIVALIHPIATNKKIVYRDGVFMILSTILLLFFMKDYQLSRIEGIIFIILLASYLIYLFIRKEPLDGDEISEDQATWKDFIILPISLAAIIFGGHFLVDSSTAIARYAGMSEWLIAITIVAAGTSAPEMVTSIAAAAKGKHGLSAGNLIGSNIFNILGVLGVAGAIRPISIEQSAYSSVILLSIMLAIIILLMRTKWKLSRINGAILVLMGIGVYILDFLHINILNIF